MDAWQTSVETRLSEIKAELRSLRDDMGRDFRWLLGAMGAGFAMMAGGFLWLADKLH